MILNNHVLVKRGKGENAGKTIPKRKNGKSAEIPAQTPEYECANRANRRHETRTCSPALRPAPPRDTGGVACWSSPRYSPATHYKNSADESSVQREAPVCPARSWCRWSCASPIAPPAPPGQIVVLPQIAQARIAAQMIPSPFLSAVVISQTPLCGGQFSCYGSLYHSQSKMSYSFLSYKILPHNTAKQHIVSTKHAI